VWALYLPSPGGEPCSGSLQSGHMKFNPIFANKNMALIAMAKYCLIEDF
jgi:hypothetical protein